MSILPKLASSLNRKDELPNQELAKEIVIKKDKAAVKELVEHLNGSKSVQNDCIKVLYEIGAQEASLIAPYLSDFVEHLSSKNNRLQWGAMTALGTITSVEPKLIYELLPQILTAANKGSVITKDHAVNILIQLCSNANYATASFPLLSEQLLKCPTNQLPMYAERTLPIVDKEKAETFVNTLQLRLPEVDKDSKRKRIEKVIQKLQKSFV